MTTKTIAISIDGIAPGLENDEQAAIIEERSEELCKLLRAQGFAVEWTDDPIESHSVDLSVAEERRFNRALWAAVTTLIDNEGDVVVNAHGVYLDTEAATQMMDDDLREALHMELAPCSEQAFFGAYCAAHAEKFGEEWELAKPNPVW